MNKYLYKKIEQAHSAYFENIIFLANEVCRESQSNAFEEFTELEPAEISKVFGWNSEPTTYELIENEIADDSFSGLLIRYNVTGFLAQCMIPECDNFRYDEAKERPVSWNVHHGICRVIWIYADSIGELVEKLQEKAEDLFTEAVSKSKLKK